MSVSVWGISRSHSLYTELNKVKFHKKLNTRALHGSVTVHIYMKAVSQQQWMLYGYHRLHTESQEDKCHYFKEILLQLNGCRSDLLWGSRSSEVWALWYMWMFYLNEWPYQPRTASDIFVLYLISSSFPSVGRPWIVSWQGWNCLTILLSNCDFK